MYDIPWFPLPLSQNTSTVRTFIQNSGGADNIQYQCTRRASSCSQLRIQVKVIYKEIWGHRVSMLHHQTFPNNFYLLKLKNQLLLEIVFNMWINCKLWLKWVWPLLLYFIQGIPCTLSLGTKTFVINFYPIQLSQYIILSTLTSSHITTKKHYVVCEPLGYKVSISEKGRMLHY